MRFRTKLKPLDKIKSSNITHCVLPISVGQNYHEEELFLSTLREIEKHFDSCAVVICDTLQRHTLQALENLSHTEAYDDSLIKGLQWRKRHESNILNLNIHTQIIHWDDVLNNTHYSTALNDVMNLFEQDQNFKDIYLSTASNFIKRKTHSEAVIYNDALNNSLKYLLEESAGRLSWLSDQPFCHIYPSIDNHCLREVHRRFEGQRVVNATVSFKKINAAENIC